MNNWFERLYKCRKEDILEEKKFSKTYWATYLSDMVKRSIEEDKKQKERLAELRTAEIYKTFMAAAMSGLLHEPNRIWEPTLLAEHAADYAKAATAELKKLLGDPENYGKSKENSST